MFFWVWTFIVGVWLGSWLGFDRFLGLGWVLVGTLVGFDRFWWVFDGVAKCQKF